jgi:hypothetical protein
MQKVTHMLQILLVVFNLLGLRSIHSVARSYLPSIAGK